MADMSECPHGEERDLCVICDRLEIENLRAKLAQAEAERDARLDKAVKALRAWEKWEADLIMSDESWEPNGMAQFPRLTQALYDEIIRLQGLRSAVLAELEKGGEWK